MEHGITYDSKQEPIVISKQILDVFFKDENPGELIAMFVFYYYTAKWQGTNVVYATKQYVMKGLNWGVIKYKRNKDKLIEFDLIKDEEKRDEKGKIMGHFVHVTFVAQRSTVLKTHTVDNQHPNALRLLDKKEKYIKEKFEYICDRLPEELVDDKIVQEALMEFVKHRFDLKKGGKNHPLTDNAMDRIVKLLRDLSKEGATRVLNQSVDKNYIGIFPKESDQKKSDVTPEQFISRYFKGDVPSTRAFVQQYQFACKTIPSYNKNDFQLAQNLVSLYTWYKQSQSKLAKKNKSIPTPGKFISDYIFWIDNEEWMDNVSPSMYRQSHSMVKKFIHYYNDEHECDVFKG